MPAASTGSEKAALPAGLRKSLFDDLHLKKRAPEFADCAKDESNVTAGLAGKFASR